MEDPEVSRLINVKEFLQNFDHVAREQEQLRCQSDNMDDFIKSKMGISDDMLEEMHNVGGKETLSCDGEPKDVTDLLKNIPEDTCLITLGVHRDNMEKRAKGMPKFERSAGKEQRYRLDEGPYKHAMCNVELDQEGKLNSQPYEPDVLLSVKVYRRFTGMDKSKRLLVSQEFNVLGRQVLTELRDVIRCSADLVCIGEYSDTPDLHGDVIAKDLYKSGFFYIEGVFYNDTRDANARDYSKTIIDWAKDPKRGIGPFTSYTMDSVCFLDLNIRIGQPYVYMHQGNCEHIIVFSDLSNYLIESE